MTLSTRSNIANYSLSIVVPMFNEGDVVDIFLERIIPIVDQLTHNFEIVCVNDGSVDRTLAKLKTWNQRDARIKAINLSRNFGKEVALTAGLDYCSGDCVIPIDADLQDPPELIPGLVEKWREGFDVVLAVRADRSSDSWIKRLTASVFYGLITRLSATPVPANAGDFRAMDKRVVQALRKLPERSRFMKGLFGWVGYHQTTITYRRPPRVAGTGKWRYWRLWNFALEGIFSFSTVPLRIWSYLGVAVSLFALGYMIWIVSRVIVLGVDVPGYASLIVTILFFSGLNMIGLGILGEYIGRIFVEVKQRPLYLIDEWVGLDQPSR
jgi:glycosyltransferase involved in cell wall biosynthesis